MKYKVLDVYLDNNLGDDLMLMLFLNYFNKDDFYIVNTNPLIKRTFNEYKNLHFIDDLKQLDEKNIKQYITIGGSVFNNTTNIKGKIMRMRRISFLKKLKKRGCKIITIGSNFGPFTDKLGKKIVQKEVSLHDLLTVRDRYSQNLYNALTPLYDDIVYSMSIKNKENIEQKEDRVGISVHNNKDNNLNLLVINQMVSVIKHYIDNKIFKEVFLFNFDIMRENDGKISLSIIEELPKEYLKYVKVISYSGINLDSFLSLYRSCRYIIGLRFHSFVLSSHFNQKYKGFSYSNKMLDYIKERYQNNNIEKLEEMKYESFMNKEVFLEYPRNETNSISHFEEVKRIIYED